MYLTFLFKYTINFFSQTDKKLQSAEVDASEGRVNSVWWRLASNCCVWISQRVQLYFRV